MEYSSSILNSMNSMNFNQNNSSSNSISFKVIYNNQNKRINDNPKSLAEMREKIKKLYELNEKKYERLKIYIYLSETDFSLIDEKFYIETESDYTKIFVELKDTKKIFKIFLEFQGEIYEENQKYLNSSSPNNLKNSPNLSQILMSKSNLNFSNVYSLNMNFSKTRFPSQCDICLINPIENVQYLCIICDDLFLCTNCEISHNHPVIKFKSNEFHSKEDICNLIMENKSNRKNTFREIILAKQSLISKLKEKFQTISKYHVRIEMEKNFYFIQPNSRFEIIFSIINDGVVSLPQDTYVYVKNCEDILFESTKVGKLFISGEKIEMFLECHTASRQKEYQIELHLYQKDTKIEYTPFKFKIKVTENINLDTEENLKNPNEYSPEDTVSTLPNEKKLILSEVVRNNYSNKDIFEICKILDSHLWVLTEDAIKELK